MFEQIDDPEQVQDRITWRQSMAEVTPYISNHPGATCVQIAKDLALKEGSVSSYLHKECDAGRLFRVGGKGARGGYGYYTMNNEVKRLIEREARDDTPPSPETSWDILMDDED